MYDSPVFHRECGYFLQVLLLIIKVYAAMFILPSTTVLEFYEHEYFHKSLAQSCGNRMMKKSKIGIHNITSFSVFLFKG